MKGLKKCIEENAQRLCYFESACSGSGKQVPTSFPVRRMLTKTTCFAPRRRNQSPDIRGVLKGPEYSPISCWGIFEVADAVGI